MTSNKSDVSNDEQSPWYRSKLLAIILFFLSVFNGILVGPYAIAQMEIKPTMLVLKRDGCDFLHQSGLSLGITLPFRANLLGSGGLILIGDQEIKLTDGQVSDVASLEDQPWSPYQRHLMSWLGACIAFIFATAAWVFFLFSSKGRQQ